MEKRLSNPPQPAELIHSCEFFVTVLLHDFPAEVFIQRPNVIHVSTIFKNSFDINLHILEFF